MDLQVAVPLDTDTLRAAVQEGAEVTPNFVQYLSQGNLQNQLTAYQNQVTAYINSTPTGSNSTVDDVMGSQVIQARNTPLLAGTLPYSIVVNGNERAEVPDSLRWKITFKLYATVSDKANGTTLIAHKLLLSQIGTRRVSASAVAATEADRNLLAQYAAEKATSLPLYLIRQKVQLKLDDSVLAETAAQRMGNSQWWNYVLEGPNVGVVEEDFKYETAVGDALVFGVDAAGVLLPQVEERFSRVNPDSAIENLHHINLGYFARVNWSDQLLAKTQGFTTVRLPSVGLFASPLTIQYSWGVPRKGSFQSYAIDIRRLTQASASVGSSGTALSADAAANFNIQLGLKNSYLEGAIFDEIFDISKGRGVSAVAVLKEANENGIGLHEVTQANLSDFLAQANGLAGDTRQAIAGYSEAGYVVMTPASPVDAVNWTAQGYIAIDPVTGSGAYIISTGINGGELIECEKKTEPLTKSISSRITTLLIIAAAVALVAAGLVAAPPTGGTSLGGAGVAIAKMMAVFGVTYLTFSASASAAGRCPTDKCHRGRFQAQGGRGANAVETSVKWELVQPLTKTQAFALIDELISQLTRRQLEARAAGFAQMKDRIAGMSPVGVCADWGDSFPKPKLPDGVRADVEVRAGQAFVD